MRLGLKMAVLMLPLAGCVAPVDGGYGGEGSYPGYAYNSGSPYYVVDGVRQPLVYYGGSWGYYDGYRRFHRAPDHVYRHLEARHPGGNGYRPWAGGGGYVAPAAVPRNNVYPGGYGGYRPAAVSPGGYGYQPGVVTPRIEPARPHYVAPGFVAPQHVAPQRVAPQYVAPRPAAVPHPVAQQTNRRRDDWRR